MAFSAASALSIMGLPINGWMKVRNTNALTGGFDFQAAPAPFGMACQIGDVGEDSFRRGINHNAIGIVERGHGMTPGAVPVLGDAVSFA